MGHRGCEPSDSARGQPPGTAASGPHEQRIGWFRVHRKLPRELWPVIAWQWSQAKNFEGMVRHLESLPESAAEMAQCQVDPSLPVTALLAESGVETGLPETWKIVRAGGSGHWVQLDRPELVISAVREMLLSYG
jgi:pimeloyl-ACP methyl ester carboxylesterase